MFTKLWNYLFGKSTPPTLPEATTPLLESVSSYVENYPVTGGRSLFHKLLLEEAENHLKEEREFLNSSAFDEAIRRAFKYSLTNRDKLIGASDLGIKESLILVFYKVFAELCKENNIKVYLNTKYIAVDGDSFHAAIEALQEDTHEHLINDKIRQMYSVGIYR